MKISYLKAADLLSAINEDLSDLHGDLALEIVEMEVQLEDEFRPNTKRVTKLNRQIQQIQRIPKNERTKENLASLRKIGDEIEDIYEKEREIDLPTFPFGGESDRDLKPHLSLKGIRAFRPLLEITKQEK